jgi:hypothetical protein
VSGVEADTKLPADQAAEIAVVILESNGVDFSTKPAWNVAVTRYGPSVVVGLKAAA